MRPLGRTSTDRARTLALNSARLLSLVVATSLGASVRVARADPDPPSAGRLAVLDQALGEDSPAEARTLHEGADGSDVGRAQALLNQERATHHETKIAQDGIFGPATLAAVRQFQTRHGLPVTGAVDAATWNKLEGAGSTGASAALPAPESAGGESAQGAPASSPGADASGSAGSPGTGSTPEAGSGGSGDESAAAKATGAAKTVEDLLTPDGHPGKSAAAPASTPAPSAHATKLTAQELNLLARLIDSEAGVCSLENKIAVGAVVLNRVRAGWANGTVTGVIEQKGQFDGVHTADFNHAPSKDSILAAQRAAAGEDPSLGATYYYNPYISHPAWGKTMHQTVEIGTSAVNTHRFMKP